MRFYRWSCCCALLFLLFSILACGGPCSGNATPPGVEPGTLEAATVGKAFEVQFSVRGAEPENLSKSLTGKLPKGLVFDNNSGKLSGTPEEAGSFSFTVSFSLLNKGSLCSAGNATRGYTLEVNPQ